MASALQVNGNDNDNGLLEGKWNADFAHHENPSRWDGSMPIFQAWQRNKYKPVQYGQCWVFAGVAGTGMPRQRAGGGREARGGGEAALTVPAPRPASLFPSFLQC